jgi:hypothetical protein
VLPELLPEVLPELLPEVLPELLPEVLPELLPEVLPELLPEPLPLPASGVTHVPPMHSWPLVHAAPVPQSHAPDTASQLSDTVGSHAPQAAPRRPQVGKLCALHAPLPSQQPVGHDPAVQPTHTPPEHVCPVAHGAPVAPQTHVPPALHESVSA